MSMTVYATEVGYSEGYVFNKVPYKHWDDLDALKSKENLAYCTKSGTPLATRSGTYNTPAPITFSGFNIDLSQGVKIKKVIVHYSHQKFSLSRSQGAKTFPIFAGPTFTLLGTGQSGKVGEAPPSTYTGYTVEFTDVTRDQLVSGSFGLKIEYPRNTSTNTGRLALGNVYLEIVTEEPQVVLDVKTENNNIVLDDTVTVECSVEHINSGEYHPVVDITFGDGLDYEECEGHGSVVLYNDAGVYRWTSEFDNRTKNTTKIQLLATSVGTKEVVVTDVETGVSKTLKINVEDYKYTVETTLNKGNTPVIEGSQCKYTVKVSTNRGTSETPTVKIQLPSGTTFVQGANSGYTVSSVNGKKVISVQKSISKDSPISLNITAVFNDTGYQTQTILVDDETYSTTNFLVQASSYESLGFTRLLIPDDYTSAMGDKIEYTLISIAKHVIKNSNINLHDWTNNLRVGIYNDTVDDVEDEDDFLSHVIWCSSMSTMKWSEYKCAFTYNSSNPLYLVYSHDYLGNPLYEDISVDFTQPLLIETQYLEQYKENKKYPVPLSALLNNTDYAVVKLDKQTDSAPVVVYNWSGIEAFKTEDVSIRGLVLNMKYNTSETVEIQVTVSADGYDKIRGYRNKTIEKGSGTLTLGGKFDLFGLIPHDLRWKANKLTVEVVVNNPYDTNATVELSDISLTCNYIVIEKSKYGFKVNGERSEEYGIFFYDMEPVLSTKNEIDEYHITGSDKSIVNRMNIKPKEIDIELAIDECELQDELEIAQDVIMKLFTNKRNVLTNKPTEKYIIFDYLPNNKYWFIRKDQIKDQIKDGTYYMTVSLYIPSGTAEIVPKVITGSSNATNGLISIEPTINVLSTTDGVIELHEKYTGQSVLVNDNTIKTGDIITVDNQNRKVTRRKSGATNSTDITGSVDFSTTWFRIRGEYLFTSPTGIITDVQYYDRR